MNLIFDALHSTFDAAEQRMDEAGIPKIVRERCPNPSCVGGFVDVPINGQVFVQRCRQCNARGYVLAEARGNWSES